MSHIATNRITDTHSLCIPNARFSLINLLDLWLSRRALSQLDAAGLDDIGLTAAQADKEAARLPWDVPANWRN